MTYTDADVGIAVAAYRDLRARPRPRETIVVARFSFGYAQIHTDGGVYPADVPLFSVARIVRTAPRAWDNQRRLRARVRYARMARARRAARIQGNVSPKGGVS